MTKKYKIIFSRVPRQEADSIKLPLMVKFRQTFTGSLLHITLLIYPVNATYYDSGELSEYVSSEFYKRFYTWDPNNGFIKSLPQSIYQKGSAKNNLFLKNNPQFERNPSLMKPRIRNSLSVSGGRQYS